MSDQTDFSALEWVKGEISDSLRQAQHALEAYVSNPKDSTKMQFCITHLHQVWGTLKMVELEGATLFASEMEALAQSIADNKVPKVSEAQEVLMQAFLQLPTYLDNLASGSKDSPVVLLPMLNDLRSTRGETLMSETLMFSPDLASGNKVANQREDSKVNDLEEQLQKVRKAYQKSLLAVLQGDAMEKNLDYMGKLLTHLQKLSGKSQLSQIWWIGGALIDGLLSGSIEFSKSVTSLLSAIDRQIKEMVDDHQKALKGKAPEQLAKNLLYYVAGSDASTKRILNVQKAYKLERALPKEVREEQSQQARRGLVNEAIVAAVDVLIEDLLNINEVLDLVVRNKGKEDERLKDLLPVVKSIAGALHVLALKDARNIMAAQYKILGACVSGKVEDVKSELMGVAGQLLAVESTLNDIAKNGVSGKILIGEISNQEKVSSDQLGVAQRALLNEAISSLETVKELFGAILAAEWDNKVLEEISNNLKILSGSLKIIPLPLASEILDQSAKYVNEKLLVSESPPEQKELETFADVLSSVDYYLEKLRTDSRSDEGSLSIGSHRLETLGFGLKDTEKLSTVTATVVEDKDEEVLSEILERDDEAQIKAEAEIAEKEKSEALEALAKEADEEEAQEQIEIQEVAQTEATEQVEVEAQTVAETASPEPDDDNVIDDEIIEIFIEEVGDVQETLKEFLPKWTADTSDSESMTEVRRAFHTLKGSGRMVGATEMGEMAWCVENMLNRVLDNTIKVNEVLLKTVLDAVDAVPELLELFKQAKNESTARSNEISDRANRIANGETVDLSETLTQDVSTISVEGESAENQQTSEDTAHEEVEQSTSPTLEHEEGDEEAPEYDMEIVEIFSQEALGHTENLLNFVAECRDKVGPWVISDDVLRVMHTLKGCANMAAIQPVAPVVTKAENFVKELRLLDKKANEDVINIIEKASLLTNRVIEELPAVTKESKNIANEALAALEHLSETLLTGEGGEIDGDSGKQQRIEKFLSFAFDTIFDGEDWLAEYLEAANDENARQASYQNLKTLADECEQIATLAFECELDEIGDLCKAIQQSCFVAQQQNISEAFVADVSKCVNRLAEIVDFMAAGQFIKSPAKLTALVKEHLSAYPEPEAYVEAVSLPEEQQETVEEAELEVEEIGEIPLPAMEEGNEEFEAPPLAQVDEELSESEGVEAEEEYIEASLPEPEPEPVAATIELRMDDDIERDGEIVEIFLEEAEELIESSANLLDQWQSDPSDISIVTQLQRDLHTLKGGARMAEFASIGDLGHELENIYEGVGTGQVKTSPELFNLLFRCHDRISEMFSDIRDQGNCYRADDLLNEINILVSGRPMVSSLDAEPETVEIEEAHEAEEISLELSDIAEDANQEVEEVQAEEVEEIEEVAQLETLQNDNASDDDDVDVSEEISAEERKRLLDAGEDSELDEDLELVEIFLEEAEEIIESSSNALEEWRGDTSNQNLVEQLQRELHTLKGGARMAQSAEIGDFAHEMENIYEGIVGNTVDKSEALINLLLVCHDRLNEMVASLKQNNQCEAADDLVEQLKLALQGRLGEQAPEKAKKKVSNEAITLEEGIAPDVIELFLNDGMEMLDQLDKALLKLASSSDTKDIANVKEVLASLSGGAKLSGFKSLGTYCEKFAKQVNAQSKEGINQQQLVEGFKPIKDFIALLSQEKTSADNAKQVKQKESKAASPAKKASEKKPAAKPADDGKQKEQESIKIAANLLENLVNLAGETSINRGRLEVQLSEFAFTIDEMEGTIERLQEQLRRLHLETEAQIVSRYEKEGPSEEEVAAMEEDDDFDPLEMDKYSAIDQLSRSLSESASDLLDLKDTLMNKTRDAETLLIQQARVNTELQEGLMRSRMVPFSRILPRLRRIVRQVGNELKKPVDLELLNAEGELDRTVLEKMISPIEHMLRNSIAHGIEKAEDRKAAGKPKNGTIWIDLGREGSNMVIKVKDDGAGVNVAAVRKKAIENGLLDPKADLPDDEIVEFIFNPGFSTASEVSQVAGRGVGMDVVASEIRALNGNIETNSITGAGTKFTIRLPFTVAVNRALMVGVGESLFAIPLTSIEGVVRVSPYELEAYYEQEDSVFNYAGVDYQLQYLGAYMHGNEKPHLIGQSRPLPVLLVQSGDHAVAMQVDSLLGSREIVVKSVGPQLSTVAGLSGATILGDGSVVIIIDIHSMIRGAIAQKESEEVQAGAIEARKEEDRPTRVMVVDDSVTVRKVTSRLLERNGMEVVLAKDGVDAITQLQDITPDVMLLDIEMPRMDGFEVATLVRHDDRLQDLPIIMITSRTGEKHKQRAMDIGVNRYMGKPFQENQLLQTIEELLKETQGAKA